MANRWHSKSVFNVSPVWRMYHARSSRIAVNPQQDPVNRTANQAICFSMDIRLIITRLVLLNVQDAPVLCDFLWDSYLLRCQSCIHLRTALRANISRQRDSSRNSFRVSCNMKLFKTKFPSWWDLKRIQIIPGLRSVQIFYLIVPGRYNLLKKNSKLKFKKKYLFKGL